MRQKETPDERVAPLISDRALEKIAGGVAAPKAVQLKFRVTNYIRDLIEEAAERNGWGASEEIRRRLEASFLGEIQAGDDETYRLLEAIRTVAHNVGPPFGKWHHIRYAFDTFRSAVIALIDLHRPAGVPVRPADNEIADMYLGDDGTPETAGRMLAGGAAAAGGIQSPGQRALIRKGTSNDQ